MEIATTLAGQGMFVTWFTENKYFYDLNQYLDLMEYEGVICSEFHALIFNVYMNQGIDLSTEPYRE